MDKRTCESSACAAAVLLIVACFEVKPAYAASNGDSGSVASNDSSNVQNQATNLITEQFGPFKLSAGPTSAGAFGANLDGKGEKDISINQVHLVEGVDNTVFPAAANIGYGADGTWTSDPKSPSNGTISLKPGIDGGLFHGLYKAGTPEINCPPHATSCGTPSVFPAYWLALGAYGDLQYRYGTIQQGTALEKVNQFDVGGGAFAVAPFTPVSSVVSIDAAPRISATYYHPAKTTGGTLALPSGITANYLQPEFHTTLGILRMGTLGADKEHYPFKFDVLYDGSKPMTGTSRPWSSLWKLQLSTGIIKVNNVYPSITYQSGRQGGFSYDKQVILGAVVEFLDPKSGN